MNKLTHVVMWTLLADRAEKHAVIAQMRQKLGSLVGVVPGLLSLTVVADVGETEANFDVMLVSEHESLEALADYQVHPAHVEVAGWVKTQVRDRAAVDYLS